MSCELWFVVCGLSFDESGNARTEKRTAEGSQSNDRLLYSLTALITVFFLLSDYSIINHLLFDFSFVVL